jgi:hypothetical protein
MKSELKTRSLKNLSAAYLAGELRGNPEYQRGLQTESRPALDYQKIGDFSLVAFRRRDALKCYVIASTANS